MTMVSRFKIGFARSELVTLGLVLTGCGSPVAPPPPPPWHALSLPRSELKLPSLFLDKSVPSDACFESLPIAAGHAVDQGTWSGELSKQFDASFNASLSKFIGDAKLEAGLASALEQKWKIEVTGLTYESVEPANVRANFGNESCTDADLNWFKNNRFVATEALKAATVTVSSESGSSESQKAQLDLAIDKVNAGLHTAFNHATSSAATSAFTASNVYIGVNGAELGAFDCQIKSTLEVAAGASTPICDGRYRVALSKSAMDGHYKLKVTSQRMPTSEFDAPLDSQAMFRLGTLQVLFVMAHAAGEGFKLETLDVLKVGAKG